MAKKNMEKSYIDFMDLLGIKSIASFDYESYFNCVIEFQRCLSRCIENNNDRQRKCIEVHIFSDCAYLESKDFRSLCSFLRNLRFQLLLQGIFFNAAITEGSLGHKFVRNNTLNGSIFQNKDTVKVCTMQTKFGGAGIYIDSLIEDIKRYESEITASCFCVWDDSKKDYSKFVSFYDVRYKSNCVENLFYIIRNFIKTVYTDKRAARYYFAAMKTCVTQMKLEEIEDFVNGLIVYKLQKFILESLEPFYYILVDHIYTIFQKDNEETDHHFDCLYDYRNENERLINLLNMLTYMFFPNGVSDNLNNLSNCLISQPNKYLLSKYFLLYNIPD